MTALSILVTGGAGFIGSSFVHHLRERHPEHRVIVLDALTYAGSMVNLPAPCTFVYGTVANVELVQDLVAQVDIVVHMAAESAVTRSIADDRTFFEIDVLGTQVVAAAVTKARDRVRLFVHVSTSEVYGTARGAAMDEDHPLEPLSPYAAAKCGADRLVYAYARTYGLPAVIVRPFNNYGPRQHLEKVVPRFITSCLLGEPLTVHGDGRAGRDFLFVEDTCEALARIIHADPAAVAGQTLNLGTGVTTTIAELAERVRGIFEAGDLPVQFLGDRPAQVFRHTCDARRARDVLGWEPRVGLAEGLARTAAWYRANPDWWRGQVGMRHIPIVTSSGKREML